MKHLYRIIFLFFLILSVNQLNAKVNGSHPDNDKILNRGNANLAWPTATINSSASSVCKDGANPMIIITGSGGTAPYIFTYKINGEVQTVISSGVGSTAVINVPTSSAATLVYSLVNVAEGSNPSVTIAGESVTVIVSPLPTVDFTFADNQCSGTAVQFTSSAIGTAPYTYLWEFGDGGISTQQNPSHQFNNTNGLTSQSFNVILTLTDVNGCQKNTTKVISIKSPDTTLSSSAESAVYNGFPIFKVCTNSLSQIDFINVSTTKSTNTNYVINWGDSSPDFISSTFSAITSHTYSVGLWTLTYTVTGQNGCSITRIYKVFVGNNPAVGIGNPGNTNVCLSTVLTFPITGTENNPPGTIYTITFNDGSVPTIFNHPPPASISHTFLKSSCGVNSISGTAYQNSFSANIEASNPCDTSSGSVVPIRISTPPIANFTAPQSFICTNSQLCFTNSSAGGSVATSSSCVAPKVVWIISPSIGFTLNSGSLGNDNNESTNTNTWTSGANSICPIFTVPGNYIITMKVGNSCGIDQIEKIICIESPLVPQFTLNTNSGCTPLAISTTNSTIITNSCPGNPTYLWTVTYTSGYCSSGTPVWNYLAGSASSANPTFNFVTPGSYSLKLTMTNSCGTVTTATQTVIVKQPPTVTINTISNFCQNIDLNPISNINICSTNSTGTTYLWTFTGGTPSTATTAVPPAVSYALAGEYSVSLSITNECGTATANSNIFSVLAAPIIQNETTAVCSGTTFSITPYNATIGNTIPIGTTYSWSNPIVTAIMAGASGTNQTTISGTLINNTNTAQTATYTITPKIGSCAGNPFTLIVTVNPIPTIMGTFNVCVGSSTTLIGSGNPVTINSWGSSNPSIATISNSGIVNGIAVGTSIITYLNSNGCTTTNIITVNPQPTVTVNSPVVCSGLSTFVIATAGIPGSYSYNWTVPSGFTPIPGNVASFSTTVVGTYSVIITNTVTGCVSSIASGTVSSKTLPNLVITNPPAVCNPMSVAINSPSITTGSDIGLTFTYWTNSAATTLLSNPNSITIGGTYYIKALNSNGCTLIKPVVVTVNPLPALPIVNPVFYCQNAVSNILTATALSNHTLNWYTVATAGTPLLGAPTPSTATVGQVNYYVSQTNSSTGCEGNRASITVTIITPPTVIVNSPTICSGLSATVIATPGSMGNYLYNWTVPIDFTNPGNLASFSTTVAGTYSVVITNSATGCSSSSTYGTVTTNALPILIITNPAVVCSPSAVDLTSISITSGSDTELTLSYWSNSMATILLTNPNRILVSGTYYIKATNENGCSVIKPVNVIVNPLPALPEVIPIFYCKNALAMTLVATAAANHTLNWYDSSTGTTPLITAPIPNTATVGSVIYYVSQTNMTTGCEGSRAALTVTTYALPTVNVNSPVVCSGLPAMVYASPGSTGNYSYVWSVPTGFTNPGNIASFSTSIEGIYSVIITHTLTGCVSSSASGIVTSYALPNLVITNPSTVCSTTTVDITNPNVTTGSDVGVTLSYWTNNLATISLINPDAISTTGTLYIKATNTNGCSVIKPVNVTVNPLPALPEVRTISYCKNALAIALEATATTNHTLNWYNSSFGATPLITAPIPSTATVGSVIYYVSQTNIETGCEGNRTPLTVVISEPPFINKQPLSNHIICIGGIIPTLSVSYTGGAGSATYQWYSNISNSIIGGTPIGTNSSSFTPPSFNSVDAVYYYVVITLNSNGCGNLTSDITEVKVLGDPTITSPLGTQTLCQGSSPINLSVTTTGGAGTYSYQWYSNVSNSAIGGTAIPAGTINTFVPPTTTIGTQHYYCVVSQTGLGCSVTSEVAKVIIVSAPAITSQPQSSSACEGGLPTPLTMTYSNGTGTASYQWYSNTSNSIEGGSPIYGAIANTYNPPASIVGKTYYYCVVTFSAGGCTIVTSNTAEVIINQIPTIANVKLKMCSGDALNFNPQSENGNSVPNNTLYTWSFTSISPLGSISGATNQNVEQSIFNQILVNNSNQIATITYTLTPRATICIGNTFTIEVTIEPNPKVNFSGQDQVICNDSSYNVINLGSITPGIISYNWNANVPNGITGAILSGTDTIPTQMLTNTTNTPLTVTYTATASLDSNNNSLGCIGPISTYSITVNPTINKSVVLSNYNGYGISLFGGKDGFVDLTVTGGSESYNYIWSGPNGFTAFSEDINEVFSGNYTVTFDDGYCNPTILSFLLTQPPELLIQEDTVAHVNLLCFGNTNGELGITITNESVAPYDFQLVDSKGKIINTIMGSASLRQSFNGLNADVYKVIVTDANGGVKILTGLTITQPTDIDISAGITPITCYGENNASITLNVAGGTAPYRAQWDNLAIGLYQNNLSAGLYAILVTDANNCSKSITVEIPDAPIFKMNPTVTQISCFGTHDGSIKLNLVGGIPPIKLIWSDNTTAGATRNNLGPGTYIVTIIDGTPCQITNTFIITEPQSMALVGNITNALDCNDANSGAINLLVSGGTPPFSYAWSNGSITEDLTSTPAGNYLVTVTDAKKCTAYGNYSILQPSPLLVKVETVTDFNCETKAVKQSFVAKASGGVPPFKYVWSNGIVSGLDNEMMNTSQNGLIILNTLDSRNCIATYTFEIAIPELGAPSFSTTSIGYSTFGLFSIEDPIQFTNTSSGDYVNIRWNFGDGTFSNEKNPIHIYKKEGDYNVSQTITYPFGCIYEHSVTLRLEKGYSLIPPTGFTPNNDGINDYFAPLFTGLNDIHFDVYDTWGSVIYSEDGENIRGWDGKINNKEAENGNYYFKIIAKTFYGKIIKDQGALVLIN